MNIGKIPIATFFLFVCSFISCTSFGQVQGNGNVISLERIATDFKKIRVEDGLEVYLSQGNDEIVQVKADRNLHEYIRTESKSGVLRVYSTKRIESASTLRIYVTCKEMSRVECFSRGKLKTESAIKGNRIQVKAKNNSKIEMEVACDNVDVYVDDEAEIELSGKTEEIEVKVRDNSTLMAQDLKAEEGEVNASGNSKVWLTVSDELSAKAKKRSKVIYRGKPKSISIKSSDDSTVTNEGF